MESLEHNPFEDNSDFKPKFAKKPRSFYISDEAHDTLVNIAKQLIGEQATVSHLLEYIGLCLFTIKPFEDSIDPESGITTEDCRKSGYLDAKLGNLPIFLQIYGKMKTDFEYAYMRGYFEGKFLRDV